VSIEVASLLGPVKEITAEAGARILAIYATAFAVTAKDDASPLTAADLASHEVILSGLQRLTPDIPILSEESSAVPFAERISWDYFWLVDPLDGTKEFIKRNGEFTINIALIHGHEPVLGVVRIPVSGTCYFAAQGQGAYRQEPDQPAQRLSVRPLGTGVIHVVGSRSHGGESLQRFVAGLKEHTLVAIGSSLKFCLVAEGQADIYPRLGPTWEWDTAAAQCIVEEAGGQVIDVRGQRLTYNKPSLLNPHFLVIGDASHEWLSYLSPFDND
jgi:3'(2'), 5'-bisphosphate nucleotidase